MVIGEMLVIPPVPIVSGNLIRDLVIEVFTRHCEERSDAAIPYTHEIASSLTSFVSRNDACVRFAICHLLFADHLSTDSSARTIPAAITLFAPFLVHE
jgi:hypothetical protein